MLPASTRCLSHSGDIKTGFLEKRIGENSGRQNLPESMKWQKRYFVLTETKGMLYYFKSADDPPNYRGVISVKDARVRAPVPVIQMSLDCMGMSPTYGSVQLVKWGGEFCAVKAV